MKKLLVALFIFILPLPVFALSGLYNTDQVWSGAQPVTSAIRIQNCIVTVSAGAVFTVTNDSTIRIRVQTGGTLIFEGTTGNPIVVDSQTGAGSEIRHLRGDCGLSR